MPGVGAREQGAGRTRHGDADPWLKDRVTLDDAPELEVEARAIERMLDHADQLPGHVARQSCVAVERDAVAGARQDSGIAHLHGEAGVGSAPQQSVEFLDLAALALPAHPHALAAVPAPRAMERVAAVL